VCGFVIVLLRFQNRLAEVQEHATSLASSGVKREARINQLETSLQQRLDEVSLLEDRLKKVVDELQLL